VTEKAQTETAQTESAWPKKSLTRKRERGSPKT